jgi:riboflavin biosynthesis pyrimidine reductase
MMSTIDGKIASGVEGVDILDNFYDLYAETENQLQAHAWMCGRVTMQMFASAKTSSLPKANNTISFENFIAQHKETNLMFGVDTKGLLRWDTNTIKLASVPDQLHLVVIVTKSTPAEYLCYLQQKNISYLVSGESDIDFSALFSMIKANFGVKKLLLEGGALLNGSVMAKGLVDEISLLITPTVLNHSGAPAVFERQQHERINLQQYALVHVQQVKKDTVWLRYEKADS